MRYDNTKSKVCTERTKCVAVAVTNLIRKNNTHKYKIEKEVQNYVKQELEI